MNAPFEPYYKPGPHDKLLAVNPTRLGGHWTEEEVQVLRNLFGSNMDPLIIARNMGRTINGILAKLRELKLIRWSLGYKAYFKTLT